MNNDDDDDKIFSSYLSLTISSSMQPCLRLTSDRRSEWRNQDTWKWESWGRFAYCSTIVVQLETFLNEPERKESFVFDSNKWWKQTLPSPNTSYLQIRSVIASLNLEMNWIFNQNGISAPCCEGSSYGKDDCLLLVINCKVMSRWEGLRTREEEEEESK